MSDGSDVKIITLYPSIHYLLKWNFWKQNGEYSVFFGEFSWGIQIHDLSRET